MNNQKWRKEYKFRKKKRKVNIVTITAGKNDTHKCCLHDYKILDFNEISI